MIRHGEKLDVEEVRKPLEESELSAEQQKKWRDALQTSGLQEPEIAYAALPKIENMAKSMVEQLPSEALVVFAPTRMPRARMTAELLAGEIAAQAQAQKKQIATAFVWEPADIATEKGSVSNIAMWPIEMAEIIRKFAEQEKADDSALRKYLEESPPQDVGNKSYWNEDQLIFETVNIDLSQQHSVIRERAELLKQQVAAVMEHFSGHPAPVYFYGVGHHHSLIALDVAFNGRIRYNSVEDLPAPLDLWKVDLKSK